MRRRIEPHPRVVEAWKTRNYMINLADRTHHWFKDTSYPMDKVCDLLSIERYKQLVAEAEAYFLDTVIMYHGNDAVVEIGTKEFKLFNTRLLD
jgi:hypothetical protein